jgi:hypothetical protein
MSDDTVTTEVGDTEVTITETDDGFEVTETEDEPTGLYLRGVSCAGSYGFEVPVNSDYELAERGYSSNKLAAAWDTEQDISERSDDGGDEIYRNSDAERDELDGHANIESVEIVEH